MNSKHPIAESNGYFSNLQLERDCLFSMGRSGLQHRRLSLGRIE
jgi:hypothetical protein